MITALHHIAIIASSMDSIDFYSRLGFTLKEQHEREYDTVVIMDGNGIQLEIFIDPEHPVRVSNPEAMGLRHIALKVDKIDDFTVFDIESIRTDWNGVRFTFIKDPDGLPIEIHE